MTEEGNGHMQVCTHRGTAAGSRRGESEREGEGEERRGRGEGEGGKGEEKGERVFRYIKHFPRQHTVFQSEYIFLKSESFKAKFELHRC